MQRLLIVGGGSAGWITAAYLNGALNDRGKNPKVKISLLESPDIPRISVGEATIPSMRHLIGVIGIPEAEFMRATDATFKQSIKYKNWVLKDGSHYHHPFTSIRERPLDSSGERWLNSDRSMPFMDTCAIQPAACEANLAPLVMRKNEATHTLNYAYHMNAQKFADLLRDVSVARGVTHIQANLTDVKQNEHGWIESVATDRTEPIIADMFVDCTGFQGHLIAKTLNVGFEDYSQFLLCDRAVTMHLPYDTLYPGTVRPYTTATALSNGWVWDIPMQNQRSIGYVHSSEFIDQSAAEAELRAYQGPGTDAIDVRFVPFKVGRRHQLWRHNCVAIGLAGGFIEPLESTGLYLSDLGAVLLAEHWPSNAAAMQKLSERYNRLMANRYYEILDFINMHYCLTQRNDTEFWREVQKPERINPRLKAKLAMWKTKPPSAHDFEDQWFDGMDALEDIFDFSHIGGRPPVDTGGLWNHESYECILYGMHYTPKLNSATAHEHRPPATRNKPTEQAMKILTALPGHVDVLSKALGMKAYHKAYTPIGWT
ncbi:MAG: tryptophan halogenase family protein [Aequoribacter sp.]|uniref:tryptophan halogenase family protein n=1 Tax=Aequoribacter sp. TaxID=2847771 RepID=UPI003C371C64